MYTIRDVSVRTGLSAHTLRFYEKQGLISGVKRSQGGFRQYSDEDMEALGLICCLKITGMLLNEIAEFVALTRKGDSTLARRVELLKKHRESVIERMSEMRNYLDKVTRKLEFFTDKLNAYESGQGKRE